METYVAIRTLCKPISKDFTPVIWTDTMVYFHKFWLWNKLKSFDVFNFIRLWLKVTSATKQQLLKWGTGQEMFYFIEKLCSVLKIFKCLYF